MKSLFFSLLMLCMVPMVSTAQTADASLDARIAEVLAKFPAQNKSEYDENVQRLHSLGEKGVQQLAGMLKAPGDSTNVPIQYAISALSSSVMQPGKESDRSMAISAYCSALKNTKNDVNKQFLINQLQLTGNDKALGCIEPYLKEDALSGAAARAITQINSPAAGKLLMNAYASAKDKASVIEGLGYMRYAPARALIETAQQSSDASLKKVATHSLKLIDQSAKSPRFKLSKEEKKEKYEVLFDGSNLDSWVGDKKGYIVENNEIVVAKGKGGNLFTKDEYADFIFRFEFMLTPAANNGLGIRAPLNGDGAYAGMELQILDNEAAIYKNLHDYQFHGSVYGVLPAKRGFLKPTGQWNYQEVIVKGTKIKVILNNEVILDGDIQSARDNGTADKQDHPGLKRNSGHIGFLGHGSVVRFRNIRVKKL